MGCDTKGIILTETKDSLEIVRRIREVVYKIDKNYSGGFSRSDYSESYSVSFKDDEDQRVVWIFIDCDCDYKNLGDKKIILSLGYWGRSIYLMQEFLTAFSDLGVCYLWENDCGEDPVIFSKPQDYWQKNNLTKPQSRIVCSANKHKISGRLILGPRHWDNTMRAQIQDGEHHGQFLQGFVDQWGEWYSREEAYKIAEKAGQLLFHKEEWGQRLYSESIF